ncbi:MAG TPA: YciI family protein [Jatrophihabitans sp.]|nr:YciI family protein [Jatrophihabitans sp.]
MKYLVLVYGNEEIWGDPSVDFASLIAEVDAFNAELRASGDMVAVEGLVTRPHAIRVENGVPVVSDGPYLEAKEYVGSYFVLDVDSEERALELARSYPALRFDTGRGGGLEVWPLMEHGCADA